MHGLRQPTRRVDDEGDSWYIDGVASSFGLRRLGKSGPVEVALADREGLGAGVVSW
jgi:hypothetical protein